MTTFTSGEWGIIMVCRLYYNNETSDYGFVREEDAVKQARHDDPNAIEYLILKYNNFIKYKTNGYFIMGADREDLIQEGMIGLYKAIMAYDSNQRISFKNFADLCITRQIITAIKTATRQKHMPLNSYISLNKPIYEEESDRLLEDLIMSYDNLDPMEIYIDSEEFKDAEKNISQHLSNLELEILTPYLDGMSYREISLETKRTEKCIDNALQRIRRKLDKYLFVDVNY